MTLRLETNYINYSLNSNMHAYNAFFCETRTVDAGMQPDSKQVQL